MYSHPEIEGSGSAAIEVAHEPCSAEHKTARTANLGSGSNLDELTKVNPLQRIESHLHVTPVFAQHWYS